MALLNRVLDVHGEMAQAIDFKRFANPTEHEKYLHLHWLAAGSNRTHNVMKEPKISCPYISNMRVAINSAAIESFSIEHVLGTIEGLHAGFGLHPYLTILTDMAKSAGFGIDNGDLGTDWYHARVLDEKSIGISVRVNWVNKTSPKCSSIQP